MNHRRFPRRDNQEWICPLAHRSLDNAWIIQNLGEEEKRNIQREKEEEDVQRKDVEKGT